MAGANYKFPGYGGRGNSKASEFNRIRMEKESGLACETTPWPSKLVSLARLVSTCV